MERRREIRFTAAEIDVQPAARHGQHGRTLFGRFIGQRGGKVFLAVEPEPGQADFVRREQDSPQRRIIMLNVSHAVTFAVRACRAGQIAFLFCAKSSSPSRKRAQTVEKPIGRAMLASGARSETLPRTFPQAALSSDRRAQRH